MTPEESSWENEGGACRPIEEEAAASWGSPNGQVPRIPSVEGDRTGHDLPSEFNPAITCALEPWEVVTLRQLAEAFFGSVQALEDGNLEGLEMAESEAFDYECEVA